jgi:hypothetical protein
LRYAGDEEKSDEDACQKKEALGVVEIGSIVNAKCINGHEDA